MTDSTPQQSKICVITGTRAEYGLLRPLLDKLQDHDRFTLQLIATGTHLSNQHGHTIDDIREDGFPITRTVDMALDNDAPVSLARSMATETNQLAEAFNELSPDLIVVLGDRYELLPVGQVATMMKIPIAHIQGGELTTGAIDDAIRHSLTKLSHLHFTAAEPYKNRVIQMGESPDRVYNTGTLALDNIQSITVPSTEELEEDLGVSLQHQNALVVYHPATMADEDPGEALGAIVGALDEFPDLGLIFTAPNADEGSGIIRNRLETYTENHERASLFEHLGSRRYLRTLGAVDVIVGNSSSGIIEAPPLETPTVNVGRRQEGRLRAETIVDVPPDTGAIEEAIRRTTSPEFQETIPTSKLPYGRGSAADSILGILEETDLDDLTPKTFHDLVDNSSINPPNPSTSSE